MAPASPHLWSARLVPGRPPQRMEVPRGHMLHITRACPVDEPIGAGRGVVAWIDLARLPASPSQQFFVPREGASLPIRLTSSAAQVCTLSVREASGVAAVDVLGYTRPCHASLSRFGLRNKFRGQHVTHSQQGMRAVEAVLSASSGFKKASASKTALAVALAEAPPPRPAAIYNPLRPAAANAAAKPALAPGAKARAAALATRVAVVKSSTVGGFTCEDRVLGTSGSAVREGQNALLRFTIRSAKDEKKLVERGEIWCRLGEAEVVDGWVDGNVDMEDVLGRWGRAVVGMRVGGARRVRVPKKSSFKGESAGDVPAGDLLFDVDLKQVKP